MALPQFFLTDQVLANEAADEIPLRLDAEDRRHFKVLRLKAGEHVAVIDAAKDYFECEIVNPGWDAPTVRICMRGTDAPAEPLITLVQGIAKGDKMDTIVQHATEVGVNAIVAVPFARSVVKWDDNQSERHMKRWQTIARNAAMQSGRRIIPDISFATGLAGLRQLIRNADALLVFWEEAPLEATIAAVLNPLLEQAQCSNADARVAVIVGPEGGLEASEVEALCAMNPLSGIASLGSSILRTETAGVIAPALVRYELTRIPKAAVLSDTAPGADE